MVGVVEPMDENIERKNEYKHPTSRKNYKRTLSAKGPRSADRNIIQDYTVLSSAYSMLYLL